MRFGDPSKDKTCAACGRTIRHVGKLCGADVYVDDSQPADVDIHVIDDAGLCYDCVTGGAHE